MKLSETTRNIIAYIALHIFLLVPAGVITASAMTAPVPAEQEDRQ